SAAYIALPGGFGTLDELFEVTTLVQTGKIPHAPIVLIGTEFWSGLLDWIKSQLLSNGLISPGDMDLLFVSDDIDAIMDHLNVHCSDCFRREEEPSLPIERESNPVLRQWPPGGGHLCPLCPSVSISRHPHTCRNRVRVE